MPDEFDRFLEHINQLRYEDKPDYDFLRSLFTSSIQRLGYQENEPYDWEKILEQEETDSLVKIESQNVPPQTDERKVIPENNTNIKQKCLRPSPLDSIEKSKGILLKLVFFTDIASVVKHNKANTQLANSSSRTDLLAKPTDGHSHLPLKQSRFISPHEFDRLKLDSTGTGDRQPIFQKRIIAHPEHRSPDTTTRRKIPLNTIDHNQTAGNGLLTYVSQQYSNAAAPGTPTVFSQWSPHNGETLTDDDLLKGNKSHSSRAEERATTLSGERTSPSNTRPHRSSSRTFHVTNTNLQSRLPSKNQRSHEPNIPVPFGTYVKNTNHYHRRQRTPSPFQYSRQ